MPLNISKLQELLTSKGFIPTKYYVLDGLVFYIELFCVKTADVFLLYIPSKYEFEMESGENVFKVKYINVDIPDNVPDEYAGKPDNLDVQDAYGNNIDLSPDSRIEEHLEDKYKHQIALDDISKEDLVTFRSIYRQIKRLKYCVQSIKYKLGIMFLNYICAIRRDDTVSCFSIKHFPRIDTKKLMVIADLEILYEKDDKFIDDIHTVRDSIYRVLEKNQHMHSRVVSRLIQNQKDISVIPEQVEKKRNQYDLMLEKLQAMLNVILKSESKVLANIHELRQNTKDGIYSDIARIQRKTQLEKELEKIQAIKEEIAKIMLQIRNKRENTVLNIDKIVFDNTIMFDSMIKNFSKLKDFC